MAELGGSAADDVPDEYYCPISGDVFVDPVVAADGHTYERALITRWLLWHDTSPLTGAHLSSKALVPNLVLRSLVQRLRGPAPSRAPRVAALPSAAATAIAAESDVPHVSFWPSEIAGSPPPASFYPLVASVGGLVSVLPGALDHELERAEMERFLSWHDVVVSELKPAWHRHVMMVDDAPLLCGGVLLPAGFQLICFGGQSTADGEWATLDCVWAKTQQQPWVRLALAPGPVPPPRVNFVAAWDAQHARVLLFGGSKAGTTQSLDDLWELRLDAPVRQWRQLATGEVGVRPPARLYHAGCCPASGGLYVFGGAPDAKTTTAGDAVLGDSWRWRDDGGWQQLSGGPSARGSTCLVPLPGTPWLFLWGGFNGARVLDDAWLFHTERSEWKALGQLSGAPSPRAGFGVATLGHDRLMLVGGFDLQSGSKADIFLIHIAAAR